jgi:hypothetical protein
LPDLKDLLFDSSRRTADIAVGLIGDNPEIFKKFLDFALSDKGPYAMRAARVVQLSSHHHPELVRPYLKEIIHKLPYFKNDGLRRGLFKILTERSLDLDEESFGILADTTFNCLNNPAEKPAMKVYSMEILFRISEFYPEIKPELISILEDQMPRSTVAVKSAGKKLLRKLYIRRKDNNKSAQVIYTKRKNDFG